MYESLGTALGGAGTGALGQLGGILSAPRRGLWGAVAGGLGAMGIGDGVAPESGADLLSQTFGMDPSSVWTQGLGMAAEVVTDPLTYMGMLGGGPLGKLWGAASGAEASLADDAARMAVARRAAQQGLVDRAAAEAGTQARFLDQAAGLQAMDNFPSMVGGRTRAYQSFDDALGSSMTNAGMGTIDEQGRLVTLGAGTPEYASVQPVRGAGGRYGGSSLVPEDPNVYAGMEPLLPDELAWLKGQTQSQLGNRWRQLGDPAGPYPAAQLGQDYASAMASQANATRPMPTLGMSMRDQMLPTSGLPQEMLSAPLPQAFEQAQKNMEMAQKLRAAMQLGAGDMARVGGAAALGSYAGGTAGFGGY